MAVVRDSERDEQYRIAMTVYLGHLQEVGATVVPDLVDVLNLDPNKAVRAACADSLSRIATPKQQIVDSLVRALTSDKEVSVRKASALGLARLKEIRSIPALKETLVEDDDAIVRAASAFALYHFGSDIGESIPLLLSALATETNQQVRIWLVKTLGLSQSRSPEVIAAVVSTLNSRIWKDGKRELARLIKQVDTETDCEILGELKRASRILGKQQGESDEQDNDIMELREAISLLSNSCKSPYERVSAFASKHRLLLGAVGVPALYILILLAIYLLNPLAVLQFAEKSRPLFEKGEKIGTRFRHLPYTPLVAASWLGYRPRALDAWVVSRRTVAENRFRSKRTVDDRKLHLPLAFRIGDEEFQDVAESALGKRLGERSCLQIVGEGGSGKTSLACQISLSALSATEGGRLFTHVALPVLIEFDEAIDSSQGSNVALVEAIRGQLEDLCDLKSGLSRHLTRELLYKQRVIAIIDGFSEMSTAVREQVKPSRPEFPVRTLIVTSRREGRFGGVHSPIIRIPGVAASSLYGFLQDYLGELGSIDVQSTSESASLFDQCALLARLARGRSITVLLAKMFAHHLKEVAQAPCPTSEIDTIDDLIIRYVVSLNKGEPSQVFPNDRVVKAATVLARESITSRLRPLPIPINVALDVLRRHAFENAEEVLRHCESGMSLLVRVGVSQDKVRFALEPLADYLGLA